MAQQYTKSNQIMVLENAFFQLKYLKTIEKFHGIN